MGARQWDSIRVVAGAPEHEELFRFRYRVYVEEMQRPQRDADHQRRRIEDALDLHAVNLAAFRGDEVVGAIRTNFANRGDLGKYEGLYQMGLAGADHPRHTAIATRFMVAQHLRHSTLAVRICLELYDLGLREEARHVFMDCNDHLVPFFQGLGFETYIDRVMHEEYGRVNPMRLDVRNEAHLAAMRSPFLPRLQPWNQAERADSHLGALPRLLEDQPA